MPRGPRCNRRLSSGCRWKVITCGWSVVQLDYDEAFAAFAWDVRLDGVQRTIKRSELTAFLCFLKNVIGPVKGIFDALWRGERKCIDPTAGDSDLWSKIWEESHLPVSNEILVEVERKREQRQCSRRALQYAAIFHCLVEEWKDCEELKPKPKEKWIFVDKKREDTKHRTEWCAEANKYRCMWKRQQVHEDARKMHRTTILVGNMGKW